ncbi:hypothetical protein THIOKS1370015 [Thiocapsa sp. KS1]|nr:hypothetical protein THIOKS1370015 [Thiocapsa sp. KS1]
MRVCDRGVRHLAQPRNRGEAHAVVDAKRTLTRFSCHGRRGSECKQSDARFDEVARVPHRERPAGHGGQVGDQSALNRTRHGMRGFEWIASRAFICEVGVDAV